MKAIQNEIKIYCDGGSRGNPGEASYAFVVYDLAGRILYQEAKKIGISTNNFAEYTAVIKALSWILSLKSIPKKVNFYLDSLLVAMQLSGKYKVKSDSIRGLYFTANKLGQETGAEILYTHVAREKNSVADLLVNEALDE